MIISCKYQVGRLKLAYKQFNNIHEWDGINFRPYADINSYRNRNESNIFILQYINCLLTLYVLSAVQEISRLFYSSMHNLKTFS